MGRGRGRLPGPAARTCGALQGRQPPSQAGGERTPRPPPPPLSLRALAKDFAVNPHHHLKSSFGLWTSFLYLGLLAREGVDGQEEMLGCCPPPSTHPHSHPLSFHGLPAMGSGGFLGACHRMVGGGAFYELPGAPQSVQLLLLFSFGLKADVGTQVKNLNSLGRDPSLSEGNENKITPSHLTKQTSTEHQYVPGTRQSTR